MQLEGIHHITASPTTPPAMENDTLSVTSCLAMCHRVAPSAERVASSFSRAMFCAERRKFQ